MLITFKLRSLVRGSAWVLIIIYVNLNIYKSRENNIMLFMKPMFSFNNCQFTTDILILNIIPMFSPNNYFEANIIFP